MITRPVGDKLLLDWEKYKQISTKISYVDALYCAIEYNLPYLYAFLHLNGKRGIELIKNL